MVFWNLDSPVLLILICLDLVNLGLEVSLFLNKVEQLFASSDGLKGLLVFLKSDIYRPDLSYFSEVGWCFWKRMFVTHIQVYGLHPDIWLYCICIPLTALQCNGMLFDTEWHTRFCLISHCSITLLFLHVICIKLCLTVLLFIADFSFFVLFSLSWKKIMLPLGKTSKISVQILHWLIQVFWPNKAGSRWLTSGRELMMITPSFQQKMLLEKRN